jgi:hypothetical protein
MMMASPCLYLLLRL